MGKTSGRLVIALVSALLATAGVVFLIVRNTAPSGSAVSGPMVNVAVASRDINAADQLGSSNVEVTQFSEKSLPPGTSDSVAAVTGQFAKVTIPKGSVLVSSLLTGEQPVVTSGTPGPTLPLKQGDVAISIPYDPDKGAGGFIQANDHIDIVLDTGATIHYGFQDVRVLSVGTPAGGSGLALTVELPRQKALALAFYVDRVSGGSNSTSTLRYVLRSTSDAGAGVQQSGSTPVDATNAQSMLDG